ncbi:MAG: nuclear transport factor 2 family protein [Terracidiphilus sp.]
MPRKSKRKRFANEAEEAAWWEAKQSRLADEFEKSTAEGRGGPATFVITGDSTVAKIQLGKKDVALARTQAKERGMRCHDYLKLILHEALWKSESGAKSPAQ